MSPRYLCVSASNMGYALVARETAHSQASPEAPQKSGIPESSSTVQLRAASLARLTVIVRQRADPSGGCQWEAHASGRECHQPGLPFLRWARANPETQYHCRFLGTSVIPVPIGTPDTTISALRFCRRPAAVSFEATGAAFPRPTAVTDDPGTPWLKR
jgi:hypothetical protein